jgi:ribosomal protection tetracycline resistance protein
MTHSGYWSRNGAHGFDKSVSSTGADFRGVTPRVLMSALQRAGTAVHEPMHRFRLEVPADTIGPMLPALGALGALPQPPAIRGATATVEGLIPAARVHDLRRRLPSLTRGEGMLESDFDSYRPVRAAIPNRPRRGCSNESPMSQNIGGHRPTNSARRSALPRSS